MTNSNNVQVITDKLMVFLKNTSIDSHLKAELVVKVTEVAEKFAPDTRWFLNVMNLVFEYAGEHVTPVIVNNFVKLIDEWRDDPDIILFTLHNYLNILENANNVQDCMIQVAAWVLGEFSDIAGEDVRQRCINALCRAIAWKFEDDTSRGWILNALMKISGFNPSEEVKSTVSRYSSSRKEDVQQRCYEFAGVCTQLDRVIDFKRNLNMNIDLNMGFMDNYVQNQLMNGAMPYRPDKSRASLGFHLGRKGEDRASEAFSQLRLEPYEAPKTEMPPAYLVSSPTYPTQPSLGAPSMRPEPSELNVRSNAWTKEGYKGKLQTAPEPSRPGTQSFPSTPAPPQFLPQTRAPEPRKPIQIMKSQKDLEKERLAQSIFGGLGGDSQGSLTSQPVRPTMTPAPVQHKTAPQPQVRNNLLDL
jgi:AP-4 complex subunit epsilon-1